MQQNDPSCPKQIILIADDKASSRELLREVLELANYDVVEAADGEEVLLRASEVNPHLVILDIHMPKRDGFGVIEELRKHSAFHHLPIIALTASASLDDKERIVRFGFDACLVKPIGPSKLRDAVAFLLQRSRRAT